MVSMCLPCIRKMGACVRVVNYAFTRTGIYQKPNALTLNFSRNKNMISLWRNLSQNYRDSMLH